MRTQRVVALVVLTACVTVAVVTVWGEITTQDVRKIVMDIRPYQVMSGTVSTSTLEVIYVLDCQAKRLAILKYDSANKVLTPVGGRDLPKDFGSPDSEGFSMVNTQLKNDRSILYVTDYTAHRAIVYEVDLLNNKVTPQQPVDLKALFGG